MSRACTSCRVTFRTGVRCPLCGHEMSETHDPRVGSRAGRFLIETRVSTGLYANVYLARSISASGPAATRAAVKVYHGPIPGELAARVQREKEALRRVRHPCVASFIEWGRMDDGSEFLVSEWIPGSPLSRLFQHGPLSWERIRPILTAVARGLAAIHEAGLVHRDLKPSNLIVPPAGDGRAAVIIDLGHALSLTASRLTTSGVVVGSPAYMAPEQATGDAVDGRADLYAAGVILYEALTGVLPFADRSAAEVMRRHIEEPVVPPRRRAPSLGIPPHADDLCMWLLAKLPGARLPSARVLDVTLGASSSVNLRGIEP